VHHRRGIGTALTWAGLAVLAFYEIWIAGRVLAA